MGGIYHLFHEAESRGFPNDTDVTERGFRCGHLCRFSSPSLFSRRFGGAVVSRSGRRVNLERDRQVKNPREGVGGLSGGFREFCVRWGCEGFSG